MNKESNALKTRREVNQIVQSGYHHRAYDHERKLVYALLIEGEDPALLLTEYPLTSRSQLGPDLMQATKNGLICLLTTISRTAIYYGADHEYSYALSDYYINLLETKNSLDALYDLYYEMIGMYRELIQQHSFTQYSIPIQAALRFIQANLYAPLNVDDAASSAHLVPAYFSKVFTQEVGIPPSQYIEQQKMKEATRMLVSQEGNVLEIAEALGYCSSSHFVQRFKKIYGVTPGKYIPTEPAAHIS